MNKVQTCSGWLCLGHRAFSTAGSLVRHIYNRAVILRQASRSLVHSTGRRLSAFRGRAITSHVAAIEADDAKTTVQRCLVLAHNFSTSSPSSTTRSNPALRAHWSIGRPVLARQPTDQEAKQSRCPIRADFIVLSICLGLILAQ